VTVYDPGMPAEEIGEVMFYVVEEDLLVLLAVVSSLLL
jgi:hypothetical protein